MSKFDSNQGIEEYDKPEQKSNFSFNFVKVYSLGVATGIFSGLLIALHYGWRPI